MTTNVLLYSGGMDSFIAYYLLTADGSKWTCLYVDLGTRYALKEIHAIRHDLAPPYQTAHFSQLGNLEQADAFVPQRNLLLLTLAQAEFGADRVALAAVRGEFSRDKHPSFFRQTSALLSYTAGKPVQAFSPLAGKTKTQAVRAFLRSINTSQDRQPWIDQLLQTVSCYDASARACGRCMSCYRRWVALENNGLAGAVAWDYPPWRWIREREQPATATLRKLPASQWLSFGMAQLDAAAAHSRRILRGEGN